MQDSRSKIAPHDYKLLLLATIYLAWLLTVLLLFGYTPTNDGEGYVEDALRCLGEGSLYPSATIYADIPFVWNIGIINLTELSLWLTGSLVPMLCLLCTMKAGTALLMALTARKLAGPGVALTALCLYVLYPNNWGQSTMVASEIPSDFFLMAALWLMLRKTSWQRMAAGGMLLGVANWFRPTAAMFMVCFAAWLLLFQRRRWWRHVAAMVGGYLLFIGTVGTSCLLRTGHFVYQAHSYWFSMVDECYDGAAVAPHWGQPLWPEGTPRYIADREGMDCFDYERIWKQRSLDWLKDHKGDYLRNIPGRIYYMYQSDYDNLSAFLPDKQEAASNFVTLPYRHLLSEWQSLSTAQWLALLCMACYAALLLLALRGTLRQLRLTNFSAVGLPLLVVVAGTLALVVVMHGETRFKDPLMPFFFMLAGMALVPKKQLTRWVSG